MEIHQLRILLELQALQNFNTPASSSNNNSLFQDMFNSMLSEQGGLGLGSNFPQNKESFFPTPQTQFPLNLQANFLPNYIQNVQAGSTSPSTQTGFDQLIEQAAQKFQLPEKLIHSIIKHESNFNPDTVSHAGASGLMQLMPRTAEGLGVKNIFDPSENIEGGSKYIRQMLDKYGGDIRLALAAYNAGPGNVDKYNGIPPFKETQNYVERVMKSFTS